MFNLCCDACIRSLFCRPLHSLYVNDAKAQNVWRTGLFVNIIVMCFWLFLTERLSSEQFNMTFDILPLF